MDTAVIRELLLPGLHMIRAQIPVSELGVDLVVDQQSGAVCHWRRGNWSGAFVAVSPAEIADDSYKDTFRARCREELMRAVRLETVR